LNSEKARTVYPPRFIPSESPPAPLKSDMEYLAMRGPFFDMCALFSMRVRVNFYYEKIEIPLCIGGFKKIESALA
jgi:hypothetical protein